MSILSARYNNADNTGAEVLTDDRGAIFVSQRDRPELWAELQLWKRAGGVIDQYVPPGEPTDRQRLEGVTGMDVTRLRRALGIDPP